MSNKQKLPNGLRVVVGLGKTGISCVKYLKQQGFDVAVTDSRENPPGLDELKKNFPNVNAHIGGIDEQLINQAAEIILSPGLPQTLPQLQNAIARKIPVIGDFEVFARIATAPICAITGSNAKSTVTTLVGEMAKAAHLKVGVGGNLGTPVLDLLEIADPDLYVLEVSSFQLETTYSMCPAAATILNISPDHLDRYASYQDYIQAKHRIYDHAKVIIFNREDELTFPNPDNSALKISFGLNHSNHSEFGLIDNYLSVGHQKLIAVNELKIKGKHNWANALASLALGQAMKIPMPSMLEALRQFKGLPHRCEWVDKKNGVSWYNDSKGTNVGATLAAINGLGAECNGKKIILLAGGQGKGQDFSPLLSAVNQYVKAIILYGEDANQIESALKKNNAQTLMKHAASFAEVIQTAAKTAEQGDIILLSPACASFDMFKDYQHRGDTFKLLVLGY